jgi:hypothetical protein
MTEVALSVIFGLLQVSAIGVPSNQDRHRCWPSRVESLRAVQLHALIDLENWLG